MRADARNKFAPPYPAWAADFLQPRRRQGHTLSKLQFSIVLFLLLLVLKVTRHALSWFPLRSRYPSTAVSKDLAEPCPWASRSRPHECASHGTHSFTCSWDILHVALLLENPGHVIVCCTTFCAIIMLCMLLHILAKEIIASKKDYCGEAGVDLKMNSFDSSFCDRKPQTNTADLQGQHMPFFHTTRVVVVGATKEWEAGGMEFSKRFIDICAACAFGK